MKTRMKVVATAAEPTKPTLVSVHKPVEGYEELNRKQKPSKKRAAHKEEGEQTPRGGFRAGAGRPPYLRPDERKKVALYMSATENERDWVAQQAAEDKLTVSYYLRKCVGLPVDV